MKNTGRKFGGLVGIDTVMQNVRIEMSKIETEITTSNLREAVNFIHRKTETESPKVPVDTGNLRHSWFENYIRRMRGTSSAIFGFSANYAMFVHENVGANFKRKGAGAQFLKAHLKRNVHTILKILGGKQ